MSEPRELTPVLYSAGTPISSQTANPKVSQQAFAAYRDLIPVRIGVDGKAI